MLLRRDSRGDCRGKKGGKKELSLCLWVGGRAACVRALPWTSEREARKRKRDGAPSHDRARCNARAAMHKQRRASRSAPAKVTRVMSRCPLCRTNSAYSAESALSPSPLWHGAARRDAGREGEETNRPHPLTRVPPRWNLLLREETLWLKASASAAQALALERTRARYATRAGTRMPRREREEGLIVKTRWSMIRA